MTASRAALSLLIPAFVLGCSSSPTGGGGGGGDGDIQATANLQFLPAQLTVTQGAAVSWEFGPVGHTVVFADVAGHPADIATVTANRLVERTFSTVGTFPYVCTIHPGMQGTVQVNASGSSVPPPPPPPPPPAPPGYP